MSEIGGRIKAERARLGLSQPALGEIAQATKWTVINWEKGESSPNAVQLSLLHAAGVDVLYVVTGVRAPAESAVVPVVELEMPQTFVKKLNQLDAAGKKAVAQMVDALSAAQGKV